MDLVEALDARGTVCFVGAGGKKTTMYALADRIERAVVTATVRIPIFDSQVDRVAVTDDPVGTVRAALDDEDGTAATPGDWPLGVVPEREREDRYLGYDPEVVDDLAAAGADAVLVKADGARMREFKAPDEREPRIPTSADTVVPIASGHVVGEPLDEQRVHRVERVAALTGLEPGDAIRPGDVATVLASERGGRKGVPDGATVVPLVNKVDDAALAADARAVASAVHDRADVSRVVLARMTADDPVVDVVESA